MTYKFIQRLVPTIVRERVDKPYPRAIRSGEDIASVAHSLIGTKAQEHFLAFLLDSKHRAIGVVPVGTGTVDACSVHPRDVFGLALVTCAQAIVVAHNHPTGDPVPSPEDWRLTDRLRAAGELLGIELIDHVVVGDARYYSFTSEEVHAFGADVSGPAFATP